MHRKILSDMNEVAGFALAALARGDKVSAARWLRVIQHGTSDVHIDMLEKLLMFQQANGDLPSIDNALAEADGRVIDGTYTRGPVL